MTYKLKKLDHSIRKLAFLLLISLMASTVGSASAQTFNFSMENNTGLNFENGSYIIEVIGLEHLANVKANLTDNNRSVIRNLYDSEPPITFDQIKLGASFITDSSAMVTIEFPEGWGYPFN